jgi:hypothetical protein
VIAFFLLCCSSHASPFGFPFPLLSAAPEIFSITGCSPPSLSSGNLTVGCPTDAASQHHLVITLSGVNLFPNLLVTVKGLPCPNVRFPEPFDGTTALCDLPDGTGLFFLLFLS